MKTISTLLLFCVGLLASTASAQQVNRMLDNAMGFIDTPYAAHTLETDGAEELIIDCDEVDCTTLVEYILAMSLCPEQGDAMMESDFAKNLQKIRYRDGKIDGYTSRLHYITDWINNGIKQGAIEDVTAANSRYTNKVNLSYMSSHPEQYSALKNSASNVAKMKQIEKALTGQEIHYLPKKELKVNGRPWIQNGDIIAFTTDTPGLDVSHMGIAIYIDGRLHVLHASSKEKKVVVDRYPLSGMLDNNKSWTGIRVLRMK